MGINQRFLFGNETNHLDVRAQQTTEALENMSTSSADFMEVDEVADLCSHSLQKNEKESNMKNPDNCKTANQNINRANDVTFKCLMFQCV